MATFTRPPTARTDDPPAFRTDDPAHLISWLQDLEYGWLPPANDHQLARLICRDSIVAVSHTGAVMIEGKLQPSLSLLASLVEG